jgi:hypothetical protein
MANLFRLSDQEVKVIKDALDISNQWYALMAKKAKDEKQQAKFRSKAQAAFTLHNDIKC